jgi:hypothetical protein
MRRVMSTIPAAAGTSKLVEAIIHESEQVQSGIERTQNGIYTSFGVILPAIFALFVLGNGEDKKSVFHPSLIATILIVAVSLGGMWSQYLWVELFRYTLFKHRVLLPRLYEATGQSGRKNLLETYGRRSVYAKIPINLFNTGVLAVLLCAHFGFVAAKPAYEALPFISGSFIAAVILSTIAVFAEGGKLEKAFPQDAQ